MFVAPGWIPAPRAWFSKLGVEDTGFLFFFFFFFLRIKTNPGQLGVSRGSGAISGDQTASRERHLLGAGTVLRFSGSLAGEVLQQGPRQLPALDPP